MSHGVANQISQDALRLQAVLPELDAKRLEVAEPFDSITIEKNTPLFELLRFLTIPLASIPDVPSPTYYISEEDKLIASLSERWNSLLEYRKTIDLFDIFVQHRTIPPAVIEDLKAVYLEYARLVLIWKTLGDSQIRESDRRENALQQN